MSIWWIGFASMGVVLHLAGHRASLFMNESNGSTGELAQNLALVLYLIAGACWVMV